MENRRVTLFKLYSNLKTALGIRNKLEVKLVPICSCSALLSLIKGPEGIKAPLPVNDILVVQ